MFEQYGEVSNSKTLAKHIVQHRSHQSVQTIAQFKSMISAVVKGNPNKYLAQVFQALRIEVNDEMGALKEMLLQLTSLLKQGGRVAIITFHSLEDRMVKNFFRNGSFEEEIEPKPRIRTAGEEPGWPPVDVVVTPAAIPSKACPMLVIGLTANFSAPILAEDPVKEVFFVDPKVVTTTSSKVEDVDCSEIFTTERFPTRTSWVLYPTELTTSTAFGDTFNLNAPSTSVLVPFLEPFMAMLTPGKIEPSSPVTFPVIALSWASNGTIAISHKKILNSRVFFIMSLV